jgi:hypothetical protein
MKERKKERKKRERKKERKIPANCRVDQLLVNDKILLDKTYECKKVKFKLSIALKENLLHLIISSYFTDSSRIKNEVDLI